jgi:hypothetical protein
MFDQSLGRKSTVTDAADASDSTVSPIILLAAVGFFSPLHQSDRA